MQSNLRSLLVLPLLAALFLPACASEADPVDAAGDIGESSAAITTTSCKLSRSAILASVTEQGKLTSELEAKLRAATGKSELEDLYAPYRPRRKTRASVARDRGLEPLAQKLLAQGSEGDPATEAAGFVGEHVAAGDEA